MGFFNKKNVAKNFRYYISEIIVVVIGILIAIQLNNWNEARQEGIEEQRALKQIVSDLYNEKYVLDFSVKRMRQSREYLKQIHYHSKTENLDSIYVHLASPFIHYKVNSEYINLKSSGKLSILSNDKLRNKIVNYYEVQYKIYEELAIEHKKLVNNRIQEYFRQEFPSDTTYLKNPTIVKTKLKDEKFRNLIVDQIGTYGIISNYINITVIDSLISSIARDTIK